MVIDQWLGGAAYANIFVVRGSGTQTTPQIRLWRLNRDGRRAQWKRWEDQLLSERAQRLARLIEHCDSLVQELADLRSSSDIHHLRGARIIGCTTTGAAMHHDALNAAGCGVVLVEEAAEVLEAHILTALSPSVKHLIMIGAGPEELL